MRCPAAPVEASIRWSVRVLAVCACATGDRSAQPSGSSDARRTRSHGGLPLERPPAVYGSRRRSAPPRARRLVADSALDNASQRDRASSDIQRRHAGLRRSARPRPRPPGKQRRVRRVPPSTAHVDGADIVLEILAPLGARDRHDVVALRQHPGQRQLRRRDALRGRDLLTLSTSRGCDRNSRPGSAGFAGDNRRPRDPRASGRRRSGSPRPSGL